MEITIVFLAGITVGIIQGLKPLIPDKKYIPIIAWAVGIAIMLLGGEHIGVTKLSAQILVGIAIGLMSMGMWSGSKTLIEKEENR